MKTRKNSRFLAALTLVALLPPALSLRASDSKAKQPYALIFGTVYGPDDRPVYGIKIKIRRAGEKKAKWELVSDHAGEFAQRVPAGTADYIVSSDDKKHPTPDVKLHIENDERKDISLHLQ